MPHLKREKVEVEYDGKKYEFWVKELTMREYAEVVRAGFGTVGKIRTVTGEPPVIDFDIVAYTMELVKRAVEDFGEFGSVDELPNTVFSVLAKKAMKLNPFPEFFVSED